MEQFSWRSMVSDELLTSICDGVGAKGDATRETVRALLTRLFEIMGGLPLVEHPLTDDACDKIARGLLDDALREAFAKDIVPHQSTGTILEDCDDGPFKHQIMLGDLVHVNWCTEGELSALPFIGPKIASRIIEERRHGGAFKGPKDLSTRVAGIGERTATALLGRLRFGQRPTLVPSPRDVVDLMKLLVSRTGASPDEGLRRVLEYATTHLGASARTRWYADQRYDDVSPAAPHDCPWIGVLRGTQYYYWLGEAIDKAQKKIDMAMFHVAMPTENHPTRLLLDKLISAKKRGVAVRVLLDRDREEDVYDSTIINTRALTILKEGGVDARFDAQDKLLHSKFLLLDSATAVVGSHNWSAGSFFEYDDVSMVINSESFAQELAQRFDDLWAAAG